MKRKWIKVIDFILQLESMKIQTNDKQMET